MSKKNPNKISTPTLDPSSLPKKQSAFSTLSPREQRFVAAIASGAKKYKAYKFADPSVSLTLHSAATSANKWLNKTKIREAITEAMQAAGCNEVMVATKVSQLMQGVIDKDAVRAIDRGITHARAILGLDAPKESHMVVDKRDIRISAAASLSELESIILKTRPETEAPQSRPLQSTPAPNHEECTSEPIVVDAIVSEPKES